MMGNFGDFLKDLNTTDTFALLLKYYCVVNLAHCFRSELLFGLV